MKIKGVYVAMIGVMLAVVCGVGYADNINNPISAGVFQMGQTLGSMLLAISLIMIMVSSFSYIMSEGDPYRAEQAKSRIVFSAVGSFMALAVMVISKIMRTANGVEVESESNPAVFVIVMGVVVAGLLIVFYSLYSRFAGQKEEEASEEQVSSITLQTDDFLSFLNEADTYTDGFQSDNLHYTREDHPFTVQIGRVEHHLRLRFYHQEVCIVDSVYHHPHHDCSFPSDIQWDQDTDALKKQLKHIHRRWYETYRMQSFTVEEWAKDSLQGVSSNTLQTKVVHLLETCHRLLSYHHQLSPDNRHVVETALPNDLHQLLQAYVSLSDEAKDKHVASVIERLDKMEEQVQSIEAQIDTQKERDLSYAFRVIDSKYASATKESE